MASPQFIQRWRWRRSGSEAMRAEAGYRRRLGFLRLVVPAAAMGVIASLVAWPLITGTGGSFRLAVGDAGLRITGRDEMLNPRFIGTDSAKQPYTVTAEVAMHTAAGGDVIFLIMPKADITLDGGDWLMVSAEQGLYDRGREKLELIGSVSMFTDTGFEVHTERVTFDLRRGTAASDEPVRSQGPWGLLESVGFRYLPEGKVFHFRGRPRLKLYPQASDEG
jgi:lipopolysaccharide export system protein LptC